MENLEVHFIASVSEESIDDIEAIAGRLKDLGCTIENILSVSGVITGSTSSGISLKALKIEGIKDIELDREVQAINKSDVHKK